MKKVPSRALEGYAVEAKDRDCREHPWLMRDDLYPSRGLAIAAHVAALCEPHLDLVLDDMDEVIEQCAPIRTVGYAHRLVQPEWVAETTEWLLDDFVERWSDEFAPDTIAASQAIQPSWRVSASVSLSEWISDQTKRFVVQVMEPAPATVAEHSWEEALALVKEVRPHWFGRQDDGPADGRERLIRWLESRKLKQRALCDALGVTEATASGWIRGRRVPEPAYRLAIELWTDREVEAHRWLEPAERKLMAKLSRIEPYRGGAK